MYTEDEAKRQKVSDAPKQGEAWLRVELTGARFVGNPEVLIRGYYQESEEGGPRVIVNPADIIPASEVAEKDDTITRQREWIKEAREVLLSGDVHFAETEYTHSRNLINSTNPDGTVKENELRKAAPELIAVARQAEKEARV